MASVQNAGVPRVKVEAAQDGAIKSDPMDEDMASPYMDDDDDGLEDGGDLDFTNAQRPLWLTQIPKRLWERLSEVGGGPDDDVEIEIGTLRVEGREDNPSRVSLKLNNNRSEFHILHREYTLKPTPVDKKRVGQPGQALVFSEQDLPGYKRKPFFWGNDDDEDGPGQVRSQLFEKIKRDEKRKENNGRWEPYTRKAIPKKTALAGTVTRELEAEPVKNKEYYEIEDRQERMALAQPEKTAITTAYKKDGTKTSVMATAAQTRAENRLNQERKQRQQDNRSVPFDENLVTHMLFEAFKLHKIWGFRELKARTHQPHEYLRRVLSKIAFKHESGDWAHKWELKDDYKDNSDLKNAEGAAPDAADDSDMDKFDPDDDDDDEGDEEFVNAM